MIKTPHPARHFSGGFLTERVLRLKYKCKKLSDYKIIIYGQICVKKGYKNQGVADSLADKFFDMFENTFELVVTEISNQNSRSLNFAKNKIKFEVIDEYSAEGKNWYVLVRDIRRNRNDN